MKDNNDKLRNNSRSENAKNEPRDSQGRFESKDKSHMSSKSTSHSTKDTNDKTDHRGMNAKNEPRDAQGRFTTKDKK